MTLHYLRAFESEDRDRIWGFLALFSRFEYALTRQGFFKKGRNGEALVDWSAFADELAPRLEAQIDTDFRAAREYLLVHPPKREMVKDGGVEWESNPRRPRETHVQHLLRVICDV